MMSLADKALGWAQSLEGGPEFIACQKGLAQTLRELVSEATTLRALAAEVRRVREENARLRNALRGVMGHTAFPLHPSRELALGLLDSIQRIAAAALHPAPDASRQEGV